MNARARKMSTPTLDAESQISAAIHTVAANPAPANDVIPLHLQTLKGTLATLISAADDFEDCAEKLGSLLSSIAMAAREDGAWAASLCDLGASYLMSRRRSNELAREAALSAILKIFPVEGGAK